MAPWINVPPGVTIDRGGRYHSPCRTCGTMRSLQWHGLANYRNLLPRECRSCSSRRTISPAFLAGRYVDPGPDPLTVDLLVTGSYHRPRPRPHKSERFLAALELWRRDPQITARVVAERLNISIRTVERYKALARRAA